jgi:hypothetical protein
MPEGVQGDARLSWKPETGNRKPETGNRSSSPEQRIFGQDFEANARPIFNFPISIFQFRASIFAEGGKSAARQLRGRHTALEGVGKWVVGSLRWYGWRDRFSPGAARTARPRNRRKNPFAFEFEPNRYAALLRCDCALHGRIASPSLRNRSARVS